MPANKSTGNLRGTPAGRWNALGFRLNKSHNIDPPDGSLESGMEEARTVYQTVKLRSEPGNSLLLNPADTAAGTVLNIPNIAPGSTPPFTPDVLYAADGILYFDTPRSVSCGRPVLSFSEVIFDIFGIDGWGKAVSERITLFGGFGTIQTDNMYATVTRIVIVQASTDSDVFGLGPGIRLGLKYPPAGVGPVTLYHEMQDGVSPTVLGTIFQVSDRGYYLPDGILPATIGWVGDWEIAYIASRVDSHEV